MPRVAKTKPAQELLEESILHGTMRDLFNKIEVLDLDDRIIAVSPELWDYINTVYQKKYIDRFEILVKPRLERGSYQFYIKENTDN